ncbi:MAG: hypothetical protein AAGC55_26840, partial [Myxococcota bacterium]
SVIAFTADSAVGPDQVEFLAERVSDGQRASLLMTRLTEGDAETQHGWREMGLEPSSGLRLWSWYAPLASWFDPCPVIGISERRCAELARRGWQYVFPYAMGTAPWLRFYDPGHFFWAGVGSLSRAEFEAIERRIIAAGLAVPGLRYGRPFALGGD